jgi:hypothetical protein
MYYGQPGDYFFHYTSADTAFEHIVQKRTLQLSPYSTMRDPSRLRSGMLPALASQLNPEMSTGSSSSNTRSCSERRPGASS